jgi:hypothetical protein
LTPEVQAERRAFCARIAEIAPERIKVVDESRAEIGARFEYGYSLRGERCCDTKPSRSRIKQNLIGWIARDGSGVVASCKSNVKGWVFRGFVSAHLVPHLKPGDVVVWDNARIHGVEGVREMIEQAGAEVLPLPRYSPDLSPIEPAWSKIKLPVKRQRPETASGLSEAVGEGVASVRASDAQGWFAHCGYPEPLPPD